MIRGRSMASQLKSSKINTNEKKFNGLPSLSKINIGDSRSQNDHFATVKHVKEKTLDLLNKHYSGNKVFISRVESIKKGTHLKLACDNAISEQTSSREVSLDKLDGEHPHGKFIKNEAKK